MKTRQSFLAAGIVATCATLFGLFETLQYYLRSLLGGFPFDFARSLSNNLSTSVVLAALTPIAFVMSRRFRLERGVMVQRLILHAVAALAFAFSAVLAIAGLFFLQNSSLSYPTLIAKLATFYVLFYFAIYWMIAGAIHAGHYYHQTQLREEKLVRERLEVLRGKLNPHFLFNTLNAISTMALQRDHEGVAQSLGLVGDMLRASLDDNLPQEIPLARELELTDKYIAIQRIRFGDRLAVERIVDPASLDAFVPSMLLQPLVENAVTHGVGTRPGQGWVRIEASRSDGHVTIAVSDSGAGFSASPRNGIGLANTRERLQTMYGDRHTFDVGTVSGGGARIEITIPVRNG